MTDEEMLAIGRMLNTADGEVLEKYIENKINTTMKGLISGEGFAPEVISQKDDKICLLINNPKYAEVRALKQLQSNFGNCKDFIKGEKK